MNVFQKIVSFFGEVKTEITKLSMPGKDELVGSTIVVLVVSAVMGVFIGVIDRGLTAAVALLFG